MRSGLSPQSPSPWRKHRESPRSTVVVAVAKIDCAFRVNLTD